MEVDQIFSAQPVGIYRFLCESGHGYYVPAYQREYSWDKSNIDRLFEDITHGLERLVQNDESLTFIGTFIGIHDVRFQTIEPQVRNDLPAKVTLVIDGQQRLTTMLLLNTVLLNRIGEIVFQLEGSESPVDVWLSRECNKLISHLSSTIEIDKSYGEDEYQYYPKLIRAYVDSWCTEKEKAKYESPVSQYLFNFIKEKYANNLGMFRAEDKSMHPKIIENLKEIMKKIKLVSTGGEDGLISFPKLEEVMESNFLQETLFHSLFPEEIKKMCPERHGDKISQFRTIVLARFILDRVAVINVTAKNQEYAFDMFESLNTTGEPLTAFETFKPFIISSETLDNYENTPSKTYVEQIENYLNRSIKPEDKLKSTKKLIINFALANSGDKLTSKDRTQRNFLRKSFEKCSDVSSKRTFLSRMATVSRFLETYWEGDPKTQGFMDIPTFNNQEDLLVRLGTLKKMKQSLTIPIVSLPLHKYLYDGATAENLKKIIDVVECLTSFTLIYRAAHRNTASIDARFRSLLKDKFCFNLSSGEIDINTFKKSLRDALATKDITDKNTWISKAKSIPIYDVNVDLAKMLIIFASHDCTIDLDSDGLEKPGRQDCMNLLKLSLLDYQVEHIAPKKNNEGNWEHDIYKNQDTCGLLGNLTLLPSSENASIGNKSWEYKKTLYKVFSSQSHDEVDQYISDAKQRGMQFSESTEMIANRSKFLPMLKAITNVDDDWTKTLIELRTERMLDNAWRHLGHNLGF